MGSNLFDETNSVEILESIPSDIISQVYTHSYTHRFELQFKPVPVPWQGKLTEVVLNHSSMMQYRIIKY